MGHLGFRHPMARSKPRATSRNNKAKTPANQPVRRSPWKRLFAWISRNPLTSSIVSALIVAGVLAVLGVAIHAVLSSGSSAPTLEQWDRQASQACRAFADKTADIGQPDTDD